MYSTKLSTPISSFEVAMDDTYNEINDPAITVAYDLSPNGEKYADTFLLIWTTTPWTLPANRAIAIAADVEYVLVQVEADENSSDKYQFIYRVYFLIIIFIQISYNYKKQEEKISSHKSKYSFDRLKGCSRDSMPSERFATHSK